MVEDSVDAIFIACGTDMVFANRAMAALVGTDGPEALVGVDASAWVVEADREGFARRVQDGQGGAPGPMVEEFSLRRVDGGVRHVEASVSPIDYLGRPASLFICSLGIIRITGFDFLGHLGFRFAFFLRNLLPS